MQRSVAQSAEIAILRHSIQFNPLFFHPTMAKGFVSGPVKTAKDLLIEVSKMAPTQFIK